MTRKTALLALVSILTSRIASAQKNALNGKCTKRYVRVLLLLIGLPGIISDVHAQTEDIQWNVAILIFNDVQIIDYTGPYEVFVNASANNHNRFNIYTVAQEAIALTTIGGMSVVPNYTFANHPPPDVVVIPGGWGVYAARKEPATLEWIRKSAAQAEIVLSVCNGAFFLAKAGLLDGLEATSTAGVVLSGRLQQEAPSARIVADKRFVDTGKIITTAGLSSGIDGAIHVVSKLLGPGWAQRVANDMEYNWQPESGYVRAQLADLYLPPPYLFPPGLREPVRYQGGTDHWETQTLVETDSSAAQVFAQVDGLLSGKVAQFLKWSKLEETPSVPSTMSRWTFTGREGKAWYAMIQVRAVTGEEHKLMMTMKVARNDVANWLN